MCSSAARPRPLPLGWGGLAVFPLRFGAAAALLEQARPPNLIVMIEEQWATVCCTAPTAYRVMLKAMDEGADLSSLRAAVSAGETLHIFITNRFDDHRPGCTGKPVTGYEAKSVDDHMTELSRGQTGRLAVRGPTGCR